MTATQRDLAEKAAVLKEDRNKGGSFLADFWTLEEMAAEIGVSPRTLARWHNLRVGPPRTLLGNRVLYNKEIARAWLMAQTEEVAYRDQVQAA